MDKCKNCGGDGLIHQGESIKFTCSACMGTGKTVEVIVSEEVKAPVEDSFLGEAGGESVPA